MKENITVVGTLQKFISHLVLTFKYLNCRNIQSKCLAILILWKRLTQSNHRFCYVQANIKEMRCAVHLLKESQRMSKSVTLPVNFYMITRNCDSSVCWPANRIHDTEIEFLHVVCSEIFLASRGVLGLKSPPVQLVSVALSLGVQQVLHEPDCLTLSSS